MPKNILSPSDAFEQLNKWKSGSTKLYMYAAISGVTAWAVGVFKHVSEAELHFGRGELDEIDLLFVVNVHRVRFALVDARDGLPFFAPRREVTRFGDVLEIILLGNDLNESRGSVIFAELFNDAIEITLP